MIAIDTRWMGQHGIGRYATEVVPRLTVRWEPLDAQGNPASLTELLRRPTIRSNNPVSLIYSPAYNMFRCSSRQIITVHDLIHLDTAWPRRAKYVAFYEGFLKPRLKQHGVVLTVSETSREAISAWLRTPRVDVINTGNGCSEAFIPTGRASSFDLPYFLYVGNLRPHKNVSTVLRALSFLDGFSMVLVCNDTYGVNKLASACGANKQVIQVSAIDDVKLAELYRGAVATVVPSLVEGFGLPALESMCCGTQVVYWKGCKSVAEICKGQGVAVQDPCDIGQWVDGMKVAANLPDSLCDPSDYSWRAVASRVNAILEAYSR